MSNKVFAIGFGFKESPAIRYTKAFTHRDDNDEAMQDFLRIAREHLNYQDSSSVIKLHDVQLVELEKIFRDANHSGSAEFIASAKGRQKDAVICIMATNEPPTCEEESYLILTLFSNGTLNALNPEQRNPLTKVFAGLPTIWMSTGGIPEDYREAHDKFPSWLMFNDPGTNRFAPTSFARYGAHFGSGNTLMMGAIVNFGVSIGDDNLLDGHCSIASCVQMGSRNKVGSFVSMEGVLSPVNADPVVVGDDNFFGTRCRIGTGIVVGNGNFWGAGVDLSLGSPLMDIRKDSLTLGQYVKAGDQNGIQNSNDTMVITNNAKRTINGASVLPGEYLLDNNTHANQERFARNDDLNKNN